MILFGDTVICGASFGLLESGKNATLQRCLFCKTPFYNNVDLVRCNHFRVGHDHFIELSGPSVRL